MRRPRKEGLLENRGGGGDKYPLRTMTEKVNLSCIFPHPLVKPAFLKTSPHFDTATVVYTLINPLGSNNFNFNRYVNNLDVKVFVDDNFIFPYEYAASLFADKYHNHIVTLNLRTINNNSSRKLSSKGLKYLS